MQIVLALAGLMLLAFVPLFFAVASLTQATVAGAREQGARVLGRAIAAARGRCAGERAARRAWTEPSRATSGWDDVEAVCVSGATGRAWPAPGRRRTPRAPPLRRRGAQRRSTVVRGATGRALEVLSPRTTPPWSRACASTTPAIAGASLVRLVALYMVTFALALLVFAYFALTRLIVRPIEQLVDAADRVASGARTLRVPRAGARELIELGTSVQSMTPRLHRTRRPSSS